MGTAVRDRDRGSQGPRHPLDRRPRTHQPRPPDRGRAHPDPDAAPRRSLAFDRTNAAMTTVGASRSPLRVRDFRLFWLGEAISTLGDQFAMIALPWLALVLTGDAFALGTVLALMALPRALFMLIGGAYVDRLSPRLVMLGSNLVRLVAVGTLGFILLEGAGAVWMLYAFALVFGIADA